MLFDQNTRYHHGPTPHETVEHAVRPVLAFQRQPRHNKKRQYHRPCPGPLRLQLKDKLEATLAALAAKKSRLRKLEKRLNGGIGGIGGGGGAGSAGVSGGDYKALQAELAGFVNLLGDSAETAAT